MGIPSPSDSEDNASMTSSSQPSGTPSMQQLHEPLASVERVSLSETAGATGTSDRVVHAGLLKETAHLQLHRDWQEDE